MNSFKEQKEYHEQQTFRLQFYLEDNFYHKNIKHHPMIDAMEEALIELYVFNKTSEKTKLFIKTSCLLAFLRFHVLYSNKEKLRLVDIERELRKIVAALNARIQHVWKLHAEWQKGTRELVLPIVNCHGECCVCFEYHFDPMDNFMMCDCGHVVNQNCFMNWFYTCLRKGKPITCPICHSSVHY